MIEQPYLAPDVIEELSDPRFITRQHSRLSTYVSGCHGPLCRYREALRGRARKEEQRQEEMRAKGKGNGFWVQDDSRAEEFAKVIEWHWEEVVQRRNAWRKAKVEAQLKARREAYEAKQRAKKEQAQNSSDYETEQTA